MGVFLFYGLKSDFKKPLELLVNHLTLILDCLGERQIRETRYLEMELYEQRERNREKQEMPQDLPKIIIYFKNKKR